MISILFENEHFIVVHKPAGFLSVPPRQPDQRPIVGLLLQQQVRQQIFPVHRLDYEVEGLLLFAKTKKSHSVANQWFEKKLVEKVYSALTLGDKAIGEKFIWKAKVLRGKKRSFESPHGLSSETHSEVIGKHARGQNENYLQWILRPITGRAHQLRFDLARNGFPILGDVLYGSTKPWQVNAIALKAYQLNLPQEALSQFGLTLCHQLEPLSMSAD